ncbi:phage gp6-like head-tail connector protein [Streptomyces sp. NBC_01500]|uniref:phage gp6-like head-tail connector protein n=1 Tax=Streptomyces sp. NBC_01500 TaxID=2903886 RepID=UPI002251AAB4|nr:phage gp6-like head-tail connector protein [Streptomyces sp. NBC_01500]MCX4554132.1 phage gp6-like head-tail connector protein [Streptomyces sp. NBC_01500]
MALVTVEEVATRLGWPLTDPEKAQVDLFISDVTALIEDYCNKDFDRRENESFDLPGSCDPWLKVPKRYLPYLTVTAVAVDGEAVTDWEYKHQTLTRALGFGDLVTVTGSWGYTNVPGPVRVAASAEVIRWRAISPGVVSERTGEREVAYEYGTSAQSQTLSDAAKAALKRYRPSIAVLSLERG